MALTRPPEATSHGKNWCPVALGASSAALLQVAPPLAENTYSIWPCPDAWAAWKPITRVPCVLSAARYGPARSKRGEVWPVGHVNAPSPHSRGPLPDNWSATNRQD